MSGLNGKLVCCVDGAKERKILCWTPSPNGVLKFNADRAARGKPCPRQDSS